MYHSSSSVLEPLLFLIYVNDMSQAAKCDLSLYADYSCLVCRHKVLNKIEKQLNEDFCNICDWFLDSKLSINFREDKVKPMLSASKFKRKNIIKLTTS